MASLVAVGAASAATVSFTAGSPSGALVLLATSTTGLVFQNTTGLIVDLRPRRPPDRRTNRIKPTLRPGLGLGRFAFGAGKVASRPWPRLPKARQAGGSFLAGPLAGDVAAQAGGPAAPFRRREPQYAPP